LQRTRQQDRLALKTPLVENEATAGNEHARWAYMVPPAKIPRSNPEAMGEFVKPFFGAAHIVIDLSGQI
jgi:hypothetical protein